MLDTEGGSTQRANQAKPTQKDRPRGGGGAYCCYIDTHTG